MAIQSDENHQVEHHCKDSFKVKLLRYGVAVLCGIVISAFLPIYEYTSIQQNQNTYPVRTHRITGKTEIYGGSWLESDSGWLAELADRLIKLGKADQAESTPIEAPLTLSPKDLRKLTGEMVIKYGHLEVMLHNGTDRIIKEITIGVLVKDSKGEERISRDYRLSPYSDAFGAKPLTVTEFGGTAGFEPEKGDEIKWKIKSATASRW